MKMIKIKPMQVIGECPAGLNLEDEFQIDGMRLENPPASRLCFLALSQIPLGQGIWQLQNDERFFSHVSCPSCTLRPDRENRVTFLLGHADKWRLCQLISEYLILSKELGESPAAIEAKKKAIAWQEQGNYLQAEKAMEIAHRELKK